MAVDRSPLSASSSKQMTLQWKAVNGAVVERVVWFRLEEGVASRRKVVVGPLPVLLASHALNVVPKQTT